MFDFDGTLVDSQHVIIASVRAAFAQWDLPVPSDAAIRGIVGLRLVEGLARLAPDLDSARHEALAQAYRDRFSLTQADAALREVLFPGVPDMLTALAGAGLTLGIATGKSLRGLTAGLERHGLTALFTTLQTGDVPPGKPHPAMLLRAIAAAGVTPADTVMIGDTSFDMAMAKAAGMTAIGVAWGYHDRAELIAEGADLVADHPSDLVRLLEGLR